MGEQEDKAAVDERFEVLEAKVLYQERTIEELNSVVIRQQDQVDALTAEVAQLREILENPPEDTIDASEEPPPPHY